MRLGMFASCLMQNNNVEQLNFVCLNVNYEVRFSFVRFAFLFGMPPFTHYFKDKPETVVSKLINVLDRCDFWDQILLQNYTKKL